jgi:hypothetical protein
MVPISREGGRQLEKMKLTHGPGVPEREEERKAAGFLGRFAGLLLGWFFPGQPSGCPALIFSSCFFFQFFVFCFVL